jgi:hypothetical protein
MKTFKALKALKAFKALKGAYLERLPQNLGLPSATPAQKISISQSGIALQYAENHDGIEGYFDPGGALESIFGRLENHAVPERTNGLDFEKFGGNGSPNYGIGQLRPSRTTYRILEQLGLDSHFERISP